MQHQRHQFVSNPEKSGQIYKLVSCYCLRHIIPKFTPFFFYPFRKTDNTQNKCNAQAVDMKLRSVASNQIQPVCIYQYEKWRQKIMEKACQVRFRFQRLKAAVNNWMLFSCYESRFINSLHCYLTFWHRSFTFNSNKSPTWRNNAGRPARLRTQHDCHHDTKVKPKAVTAVIELLMIGEKTPKTCWAVNKRQDNKLKNCCIRSVIYLNCTVMHGLINLKYYI
jgi:hypothetical protein